MIRQKNVVVTVNTVQTKALRMWYTIHLVKMLYANMKNSFSLCDMHSQLFLLLLKKGTEI